MPLDILLVLVIGGVSLVVALTWLMGWSEIIEVTPERILRQLAHDLPEETVEEITIAEDHRSALATTPTSAIVVFALGDRLVSRVLPDRPDVEVTDTTLRLRLPDPGCPRVTLSLPRSPARQALLARLTRS